jgi:hypothetical protein
MRKKLVKEEKSSQRGMKKYQPFDALEGFNEIIENTMLEATHIEKPILSEEQEIEINDKLLSYNHDNVKLKYYSLGKIKEVEGIINSIDYLNKKLKISNITIFLTNLLDIQFIN